ncbi:MAG: tripartite tricarboxylate transporter substrate binding protein [Betaproteobacteria bacterium]|nr:MAG: tripartite tricarboxylate transporter substrate binding protein [Betaproteobacteria bacterium]
MRQFLAGVVLLAAAGGAAAQAWPAKPIRLIAPYAAGGPIDISARLLAPKLQQALGQPVLVENRPGAGGNIGADFVAKSAPDGYTLVIGAIATHAINPWLFAAMPYDPIRDFRPVALIVQVPNVLVVNNELPARSVKDLIALAKARPGKLDFASGSTGSTGHLAGEMFKLMTGTYMVHIPYKGAAPAVTDLMAGRVHLMFDNLASALPNVKAGKVRALAVTTQQRSGFLPELPTLDEAGLKGFEMTTWWGVMAPAKTPDAVVQRLNAEIFKALELADVKERLRAMGSETPAVRTPQAFSAFVASELKTYGELVKRSGAKPD